MKIWKLLFVASMVLVFAGCNSRTQNLQLRNINAHQAQTIKQQQLLIDALKEKIDGPTDTYTSTSSVPQAPKRNVTLKKVEDTNYNSGYMYPGENKKVTAPTPQEVTTSSSPSGTSSSTGMSKEECIGMIGEDKFAKYTKMFGSEASSLKRCTILKAMKK
jgi:uncharacterized protein YcfL